VVKLLLLMNLINESKLFRVFTNLVLFFVLSGFILIATPFNVVAESTKRQSHGADMHYQKGKKLYDKKDYKRAYPHLRKAADMGHSDAQMHLGKMVYNGWGVKHNHATGRAWHEKAAAQGNEESKRKLENMNHH